MYIFFLEMACRYIQFFFTDDGFAYLYWCSWKLAVFIMGHSQNVEPKALLFLLWVSHKMWNQKHIIQAVFKNRNCFANWYLDSLYIMHCNKLSAYTFDCFSILNLNNVYLLSKSNNKHADWYIKIKKKCIIYALLKGILIK